MLLTPVLILSTTCISSLGWLYPGNKLKTHMLNFCKCQGLLKDKGRFLFPQQEFINSVTGTRRLRSRRTNTQKLRMFRGALCQIRRAWPCSWGGGKMRTKMLEIKRQEVRYVWTPYSLGQPTPLSGKENIHVGQGKESQEQPQETLPVTGKNNGVFTILRPIWHGGSTVAMAEEGLQSSGVCRVTQILLQRNKKNLKIVRFSPQCGIKSAMKMKSRRHKFRKSRR